MTTDGWVDVWLDSLRDRYRRQKLSQVTQTALSWAVAFLCLIYYAVSYSLSSSRRWFPDVWLQQQQQHQTHLPLVTLPQTSAPSYQNLGEIIRTRLCQAGSSSDGWTATALVVVAIRQDLTLRRLVSEFMTRQQPPLQGKDASLYAKLDAIWLDLLLLPSMDTVTDTQDSNATTTTTTTTDSPPALTLVMAAYREKGVSVANTLQHALLRCQNPRNIQVVLVDAGQNEGLKEAMSWHHDCWGRLDIVPVTTNRGRGPSLNEGATHAQGRIITFLHSDTLLPEHWDQKVLQTFSCHDDGVVTTHACAFRFGHDLRQGRPCGIGAVRLLGNLRASWLKLPYGDHVISMPTQYFRYLGSFPDQPIMEDYALMDLLRKRARILPERLCIIDGPSAQCSVRRWEALGVAYVTLVNVLIVYRYTQCGWTANDVFDYYYRRPHRHIQSLKEKE